VKILIVAQHVNFFRNLDTVIRELCLRGHSVVFLHGLDLDDPRVLKKIERKRKNETVFVRDRGLTETEAAIPGLTSGYRPRPPEASCRALRFGRQVLNRALYLRPDHPSPDRVVESLEREMPAEVVSGLHSGFWTRVLRRPSSFTFWRALEEASPASPTLCALLNDIAPHAVVISPTVWPKELVEADYIRAARQLGIPTIGYVNSWDNLTGKGTVHVLPDQYIVWNEPTAREAVDLHHIPAATIRITGAPHLDRFFEMRTTANREQVCGAMGCPTDRPYVTYLCSSRTLMPTEVDVVTRVADALRAQRPDRTPTLVVRPHPTNAAAWRDYSQPGVVVYPKDGDFADSDESWQAYYNQLANGRCVIGINTTAFLESVVAGQPCLTIVSDELWPAQGQTGHFRHLLKGDFMEVARDATEVALRVTRILDGADEKQAQRRAFARWFLRPCGLDQPAARIIADVIERAALPDPTHLLAPTGHSANPVPGLALSSEEVGLAPRVSAGASQPVSAGV